MKIKKMKEAIEAKVDEIRKAENSEERNQERLGLESRYEKLCDLEKAGFSSTEDVIALVRELEPELEPEPEPETEPEPEEDDVDGSAE